MTSLSDVINQDSQGAVWVEQLFIVICKKKQVCKAKCGIVLLPPYLMAMKELQKLRPFIVYTLLPRLLKCQLALDCACSATPSN